MMIKRRLTSVWIGTSANFQLNAPVINMVMKVKSVQYLGYVSLKVNGRQGDMNIDQMETRDKNIGMPVRRGWQL